MQNRVGGIIALRCGSLGVLRAKGVFTYSVGGVTREPVLGSDGKVHGYKETTVAPKLSGEITDAMDFSLSTLQGVRAETISMDLPNGKTFMIHEGFLMNVPEPTTEEGAIPVEFSGLRAEEV